MAGDPRAMRENPLFLSVGLGHSSSKTLAQYEHEVRVEICTVSRPLDVIPDIEYLQSITTPRLNTTHPAPNSAPPMMEDRRGPTLSNIAPRGRADTYITISSESSPEGSASRTLVTLLATVNKKLSLVSCALHVFSSSRHRSE
jgi:hypothetical protein